MDKESAMNTEAENLAADATDTTAVSFADVQTKMIQSIGK